jgi:hypothetical protein
MNLDVVSSYDVASNCMDIREKQTGGKMQKEAMMA